MTLHGALLRLGARLPLRWQLPAHALLDRWAAIEPEMACLERIGPCAGTAVDVGANYGPYSYFLARRYARVLAFEPNLPVARPLVAWAHPAVTVHGVALSDTEGHATLHVPTLDGREMTGWASLDAGRLGAATATRALDVPVRTLDSYGLDDVGFMKIDVEGHELAVLRGARATLERCRPHLLLELGDPAAERLLADLGYRRRTLEELAGVAGARQNAIFTPT